MENAWGDNFLVGLGIDDVSETKKATKGTWGNEQIIPCFTANVETGRIQTPQSNVDRDKRLLHEHHFNPGDFEVTLEALARISGRFHALVST